jgi:hypothetical protein
MSTSPLSPQEIRAAAEAHHELGPEYSDAVIASFLEKVDRQVDARVDTRLAATPQAEPAKLDRRRTLLKGIAIGTAVSGIPLIVGRLLGNALKDSLQQRGDLIGVINTDGFVSQVTMIHFVAFQPDLMRSTAHRLTGATFFGQRSIFAWSQP